MNFRNIKSFLAAGILGTFAVSTFSGTATADVISLDILNNEEVPITIKILSGEESPGSDYCYDPRPGGSGSVVGAGEEIAPGGYYSLKFDRYNGDCDGEGGRFHVQFKIGENGSRGTKKAYFGYSSRGKLSKDETYAKPYKGTLQDSGANNHYTYITPGTAKKLVAGRAIGRWQYICDSICTTTTQTTVSETHTSSKESSTEEKSAISISLSAGVELGAFSGGSEFSTSQEKTMGETVSKSFSSNRTVSTTREFGQYNADKMNEFGIQSIWLWVVDIEINGETKTIPSVRYGCSANGGPPTTISPDPSKKDRSCLGGLAAK